MLEIDNRSVLIGVGPCISSRMIPQVAASHGDVPPGMVRHAHDFLKRGIIKRGAFALDRDISCKQLHLQGAFEMHCNPDRLADLRKLVNPSLAICGINTGYKANVDLLSGEHTFEGQLEYSKKRGRCGA